jgi:PAS domain S-box-containing protein
MIEQLRKTAIDIIGDVPWGTHFCLFYQSKEDLIDILVSYFKAGLQNNEFCMWITSEPLNVEEAKKSLKQAVPNLDDYIKKGQIEILDYSQWYTKSGIFEADKVLQGWLEKHDKAVKRGFDGLRLTGNTFWLEKTDWKAFDDYERTVNSVIGKYKMLAICTYSLDKCGPSEIVDVVSSHQFALIKKKGKWEVIESSEHKMAEKDVAAERDKLQVTLDTVEGGVTIQDCEYNIIYQNKFLKDRFGGLGGKCYRVYEGREEIGEGCPVKKAFGDGKSHAVERKVMMPTGELAYWDNTASPIKDEKGEIVACVELARDVTEHKKIQEALEKSENRYQTSIELTQQLAWTTNNDGNVVEDIPTWRKFTGQSYEETKGIGWTKALHPDDVERAIQVWKKAIESKSAYETEYRVRRSDGIYRYFLARGVPILKKEDGNIKEWVGVCVDITEHKKVEEALKESEQRFRNIFDNAADGIVLADVENGKFHISNKTFSQMLGYNAEEIKNLGVSDIHPKESLPYVTEQFEKQARGEFALARDIPVERKDGSIFYADINTHSIKLSGKKYLMGIFRDVTERKQAEQALWESQRWQIAILDSIPDMAWLKDKQSRYVAANETLCRAFGIKLEDFIGKTDFDISPEDLAKRYQADDQKVIQSGKRLRIEEPWATKEDTGERICIETIKTPICNEKGEIIGTSGIARDITERKKAEDQIKILKRQIDFILGAAKTGLDIIDSQFNIHFIDPEWQKIYGDPTGKKCYDYFMGRKKVCPGCGIVKALQTKSIVVSEEVLVKENNRPIQVTTIPFQNEKGEWLVAEVNVDISERKKAEEGLRKSENKYKTLLESIPQKIFLKDINSVYISCSENYARDMKIKAEEIAGKTDYDFYPRELAEKYRADDKKIIESGETKDIEETYIQDGQERIVHTVKTLVRDEQGNVIGILGIFWDITKVKQTEEELDIYREQMTRAERLASLGTLSATVAHELTQPLTVISLAIENSLAELKKISCPDSVMEDLKKGLSEVSNANSIVNRFRDFARSSPDKSVRKVDLKAVADRITGLLEESARRVRVTLQVKGMGRLPPIYSNEKELEQLFFALVDNAIQSADGEKNHRLIISGHLRDDHYVELRFSDNCGGVAPENIDRIFEPFFTTRPQGKGTGLGLCIVQRITLRAGGKVRVESKIGEGSTFLVTLPINPH